MANLRKFDCETNSPCQYWRKCIEKSIENMDTDVRVERVKKKSMTDCVIQVDCLMLKCFSSNAIPL